MKAYVLHDIGDLRFEDVEVPELTEGSVIVSVKAAGICGSDIPRIYSTGTYSYPLIPGHEFAGEVERTGPGVDASWLHKRVGIFPLIPCNKCTSCRQQQYELCRNYGYLGSRTNGGFAEYVRVPAWNLVELPDEVSMAQAAMLEPMSVAVHAIRRAGVLREDSVAVCGLGTIGLLVVMFLREMGCAHIYCIGNKDFQRGAVEALGVPAENYCSITEHNADKWLAGKTGGDGVAVFFECVGKNETLLQGLNGTAAGGRIQLVGNPATDMQLDKLIYWKILRRQLTVLGTWNSSFTHCAEDDWHYVLSRLRQGKLHPERLITQEYPFAELGKGFRLMRDKEEDYVKIIGTI